MALNVFLILLVIILLGVIVFGRLSLLKKSGSSSSPQDKKDEKEGGPSDVSLRDPITNLYNHEHLIRRLKELMGQCDRKREKMALVLWDIDGFIEFNNRYGQQEGDKFLKKVANTIRRSIRIYDEAFRSGADEFCAVLIPADENTVDEVTQRVSHTVSQDLFEGTSQYANEKFSISSGVVYYPSSHKLPEALLYAAGEELFQTKSKAKQK
ncbi:hypothetical protein BVX98_01855 [bacterium F11]|nr:hypothetical protein BVX98_01855 [bacterium F11]